MEEPSKRSNRNNSNDPESFRRQFERNLNISKRRRGPDDDEYHKPDRREPRVERDPLQGEVSFKVPMDHFDLNCLVGKVGIFKPWSSVNDDGFADHEYLNLTDLIFDDPSKPRLAEYLRTNYPTVRQLFVTFYFFEPLWDSVAQEDMKKVASQLLPLMKTFNFSIGFDLDTPLRKHRTDGADGNAQKRLAYELMLTTMKIEAAQQWSEGLPCEPLINEDRRVTWGRGYDLKVRP
jgi:hypothetical protein